MKRFKILLILFSFISSYTLFSCTAEDDIESIFYDKTWYITGASINGVKLNGSDIKTLYNEIETYYVFFGSNNTFTCILDRYCHITGIWTADGKNQMFDITIKELTNTNNNVLSTNLYNIIKNVKIYKGDTNNLTLSQDGQNYINLSINKNIPSL